MYEYCEDCDHREITEFEENISELVNNEVKRLVEKRVTDIEAIKANDSKLKTEISKLHNELRDCKVNLVKKDYEIESFKKDILKETEKFKADFTKDFFTKTFGEWIGKNKAYYTNDCRTDLKCPHCKGTKKVEATLIGGQNVKVDCEFCKGEGKFDIYKRYVNDFYISQLLLNEKGTLIFISSGYPKEFKNDYHWDKELKQKECDEYNKILENNLNERYQKWLKK